MTRPWSLRRRLVRRVVLGACVAWLVGVGLAMLVVSHEMTELMDDSLEGSARLSLALYRGAGQVGALAPGDDAIRIIDAGVAVTEAPWPPVSAIGGQDVPGWRVFRLADPDGDIVIEVGHTSAWRRDELREALLWLVALMLPVLLAAPVAIRGAVGSALRPATRFADALRARSAQDLSPVAAPDLPVELTPIPQALNGYLDTIRARINAERQFATNAAHELRTPIAAASGQAQLIAAGLADDAAAGRLAGALGRMGHLVERLLQLSRAEAGAMGAGPCDLIRVARMVIDDLGQPVRFDDGEMTTAPVAVDPDALALILRNLLRNAADHGAGDLRVVIADGPVLSVGNAVGAGAAFRHATFDKSATSQGAGLGLAIIARVAAAQGITVDYAMAGDRAVVTLRLPRGEEGSAVKAE
ncbi:MAG: sensor histidine kinase [Paracoccus hibiscisoli]|uniref:sensor histidine kinase n=1 Tax=Paracoccus hibiscisoli TaxID=2023261 RepID=UPI00391A1638